MILDRASEDGPGFGAFHFQSFTREIHKFAAHSAVAEGRTVLCVERDETFEASCLSCLGEGVEQRLAREGLDRANIAVVLPPLTSTAFVSRLADVLRLPAARMVYPPAGARDLYTSSLAVALQVLGARRGLQSGDVGLILGVGSGIQVGCATYHF
jgi:3-oxoacyl-[acyl-carrier-protein] synthase III